MVFGILIWLNQKNPGGRDVSVIEPIQVIRIQRRGDTFVLETDTGRTGLGNNPAQAIADMSQTSDREIFLDTTEYLLVQEDANADISGMIPFLRPSCKLYRENGNMDISQAGGYLETHEPGVTLKQYKFKPVQLPEIIMVEERIYLVQS
jgi:hypothetical protein